MACQSYLHLDEDDLWDKSNALGVVYLILLPKVYMQCYDVKYVVNDKLSKA